MLGFDDMKERMRQKLFAAGAQVANPALAAMMNDDDTVQFVIDGLVAEGKVRKVVECGETFYTMSGSEVSE